MALKEELELELYIGSGMHVTFDPICSRLPGVSNLQLTMSVSFFVSDGDEFCAEQLPFCWPTPSEGGPTDCLILKYPELTPRRGT